MYLNRNMLCILYWGAKAIGHGHASAAFWLKLIFCSGIFIVTNLATAEDQFGGNKTTLMLPLGDKTPANYWTVLKDPSQPTNVESFGRVFNTTDPVTGAVHIWLIVLPVEVLPVDKSGPGGASFYQHPKVSLDLIFNSEITETNKLKFTFRPGESPRAYHGRIYWAKGWKTPSISSTNDVDIFSSSDRTTIVMAVADTGLVYWTTNSGSSWNVIHTPGTYWFTLSYEPRNNTGFSAKATILSVVPEAMQMATNQTWYALGTESHGNSLLLSGGQSSPALSISHVADQIIVSWPSAFTNYTLQQKFDLAATEWITLTNVPTLEIAKQQNEIVLSATNGNSFFRLTSQ